VPRYSEGEVIGLVHGMLRIHSDEICRSLTSMGSQFSSQYLFDGKWLVDFDGFLSWEVYEGSNAIRTMNETC